MRDRHKSEREGGREGVKKCVEEKGRRGGRWSGKDKDEGGARGEWKKRGKVEKEEEGGELEEKEKWWAEC